MVSALYIVRPTAHVSLLPEEDQVIGGVRLICDEGAVQLDVGGISLIYEDEATGLKILFEAIRDGLANLVSFQVAAKHATEHILLALGEGAFAVYGFVWDTGTIMTIVIVGAFFFVIFYRIIYTKLRGITAEAVVTGYDESYFFCIPGDSSHNSS